MSTTPPATDPIPPAPTPTGDAFVPALRPVETAPSAVLAEGPMLARMVGFAGLFAFVLGAVVVITTRYTGQARWVPEWLGMMSAGLGLTLMLYHAVSDGEQEVRRMYGALSVGLLLVAFASGLVPGPIDAASKTMGHYLLPWGLGAGLLSLLFAVPFTRHETDDFLRNIVGYGMLGVGSLLCVGVVVAGLRNPDWLAGTGLALGLLGLGFLCAYLGQVETADGIGYVVAFALGAVGAAVAFYVFARTVFPTVLYEGPQVLRKADQSLDYWRVAGRGLVILAFLSVGAIGALGKFPLWLRAVLGAIGVIGVGVFAAASFGTQLTTPPKPFLVPGGLILEGLGLAYLAVALGICSDSQFVTLTRRELSAFFFSPIGYLVLAGMVLMEWLAYWLFVDTLDRVSAGGRGEIPEPIVQFYFVAIFPVFALVILVPLLTMRMFAEEKRTGTLEVMLTAPVNEWVVALSKFFATWLFFMLCWIPSGLFLVVLKMEGGQAFDYRPLLGFYLALAATGAAFVAIGMFLSALTNNQIVAAVLTAGVMMFFVACYLASRSQLGIGPVTHALLLKFSFLTLWNTSLSGQLPLRDVILWASLAVFFVFLSIKVLETRRWS